jgi:hypothetical protein
MSVLTFQEKRLEGNSIFLSYLPATAIVSIDSCVETIAAGVDASHYFEKYFRYTIDGVKYNDWIPFTGQSDLIAIPILPHQIFEIEFVYNKIQPVGDDQLNVDSLVINVTKQAIAPQLHYDSTVFKQFFNIDDEKILAWYVNVLNKVYDSGVIPDYIKRGEAAISDEDFLHFWGAISKFFAYYVAYAREFQTFYQNESLLREYLEQRGMKISNKTTLPQMVSLMEDFYAEVCKRGTMRIVRDTDIEGELLRAVWYDATVDDIVFNPRLPQHTGWNLRNSSPLYRGLYLHDNANKMVEQQIYPQDISNYDGVDIAIVTDAPHTVLQVPTSITPIDFIKVSSEADYELSFLIKTAAQFSISIESFDKDYNPLPTYSYKDGSNDGLALDEVAFCRSDKYFPVKICLYNANKPLFSGDTTSINRGHDIKLHSNAVWIKYVISTDAELLMYRVRLLPMATSYSHGLIQTNNIIDCFVTNNDNRFSMKELREYIVKYLIPYNSNLLLFEIRDLGEVTQEVRTDSLSWIGGGSYCEIAQWRPIEPYCEQIGWRPQQSSMYCVQQEILAWRPIAPYCVTEAVTAWRPIEPYCVQVEALPLFEHLVIRYLWAPEAGADLDTLTGIIEGNTNFDQEYVGYGNQFTVPQPEVGFNTAYLTHGGDNTENGVETVLLRALDLAQDSPASLNIIKLGLYCHWYNIRLTGDISFQLEAYVGGSMAQEGFDFVNVGGTLVYSATFATNVATSSQISTIENYELVGIVEYNKAEQTAILIQI